jgi:hypothetical protein
LRHVPVIDVNSRKYRKGDKVVEEHLDEPQLHQICHNSQERAARGEYGLLLLGHTTDGGKEVDQPPVVGFVKNYQVGEHLGRPTILADAYIYRDADPSHILRQFPRRSAEIIGLEEPDGYVDSLSLIKRAPERDLGLITHYAVNHDASQESGSVVRFRSRYPVYRFACPKSKGTPDRFCPDDGHGYEDDGHDDHNDHGYEEEEEGQAMPKVVEGRDEKAVKLMKHLIQALLEQVAGEEEEMGDEEGLEEEGLAEEEGLDPSGLEMEEGLEDEDEAEAEDEFDDEFDEPSRHREHAHGREGHDRHESHYAQGDPSDPSMDPSGDPSRMRSRERPSRHGAVPAKGDMSRNRSGKRLDPTPSKVPNHGSHGAPSRHAAGGGGGGGGGASAGSMGGGTGGSMSGSSMGGGGKGTGFPGATSSSTPEFSSGRRLKVPGTKSSSKAPGKVRMHKEGREVAREVPGDIEAGTRRPSRMQRDSERTTVSRYRREVEELKATVAELQKGRDADQLRARKAVMERHAIQLESEGYILNREKVVRRFMKCTDKKDLAAEIDEIRTSYKRSPVGQPMLPDVWTDVGGRGQRPERDMSQAEWSQNDTDAQGCEIVGSSIARFAADPENKVNGVKVEGALNAISRFAESRKVSRGRRTDEDN